jgi:lipopolysaccharide transport system ATP-binding protein
MTTPIIESHNLSKRYRLGAFGSDSIKEDVGRLMNRLTRRKDQKLISENQAGGTLWALNNVSFNVNHGEVVGIVGGNGAGKSTLLKILSRITEPTQGEAILRGRVASLLEVGTGFHPDLSGRENIFLNAAILGMKKGETKRKLEEIIAFSEVEEFIDTPVKRYSSGMRVRLAFAVAAFLEPEILIVDEVLAVGDEGFQRKCLGKMSDVARHGRTILFVSHDLAAVQNLCERVIVLRKGEVLADGRPAEAIGTYLAGIPRYVTEAESGVSEQLGPRFASFSVSQGPNTVDELLTAGKPAYFSIRLEGIRTSSWCSLDIFHESGTLVTRLSSKGAESRFAGGAARFDCVMDPLLLAPGRYRVAGEIIYQDEVQQHNEHVAAFTVRPGVVNGNQVINYRTCGVVNLPHRWEFRIPRNTEFELAEGEPDSTMEKAESLIG